MTTLAIQAPPTLSARHTSQLFGELEQCSHVTTLPSLETEGPWSGRVSKVIRLVGHGMPPRGRAGRRGDLMVQVVVDTPQALTPEQEQLFRRMAEIDKTQVGTHGKKSFFSKLKDLFGTDEK